MGWKEILAWVIPIVASCIITTVIGFLIKHYLTKYFNKVEADRKAKQEREDADRQELEQYRKEHEATELANLISGAVKKANEPIIQKIDEIDAKLEQDREATITVIRAKLKNLRDQYKKQGYADAGDKATWNKLYDNYHEMGGNFFKEFVDEWKKEINDLPYELDEEEEDNFPFFTNTIRPIVTAKKAAVAAKAPAKKDKKEEKELIKK